MGKPIEVVGVRLTLPSGADVFQQRAADSEVNPGRIGFFGGRVEAQDAAADYDQRYHVAITREITEETSLDPKQLSLRLAEVFDISKQDTGRDDIRYAFFEGVVANADFELNEESVGIAILHREAALQQEKLSGAARFILTANLEQQ